MPSTFGNLSFLIPAPLLGRWKDARRKTQSQSCILLVHFWVNFKPLCLLYRLCLDGLWLGCRRRLEGDPLYNCFVQGRWCCCFCGFHRRGRGRHNRFRRNYFLRLRARLRFRRNYFLRLRARLRIPPYIKTWSPRDRRSITRSKLLDNSN